MNKFKVVLIAGALALAACGGDDNNDNNGNNTTPTDTNNQSTPTTNNETNKETTDTTGGTTGGTITPEPIADVPTCADTPAPERCAIAPEDVEWGPASVVDTFWVAGTEDDPECCYDYGGFDDEIDNILGQTLEPMGMLGDINDSIEESLTSGSLVLLLEHNGITDLASSDPYEVNFYIGAHADEAAFEADGFLLEGGNDALISSASFDQGSHPQAYLPEAELSAGALSAGPGSVKVQIELFGSNVELTISLARTDAEIVQANSSLTDGGIRLQNGKLGGAVRVKDVFSALNTFVNNSCSCLGLDADEALVNVDTGACGDTVTDTCDDICKGIADNCTLFPILGGLSDIDSDGDTVPDAVSIGAFYSAVGANITGVD